MRLPREILELSRFAGCWVCLTVYLVQAEEASCACCHPSDASVCKLSDLMRQPWLILKRNSLARGILPLSFRQPQIRRGVLQITCK